MIIIAKLNDCNTLAPLSIPIKSNQLNPTTIPNTNRLSATLMPVDECEGGELRYPNMKDMIEKLQEVLENSQYPFMS